jgi:hypothetical protein
MARQIAAVQTESVTQPMDKRTDKKLWRRVFAADALHVLATAADRDCVHRTLLLELWEFLDQPSENRSLIGRSCAANLDKQLLQGWPIKSQVARTLVAHGADCS